MTDEKKKKRRELAIATIALLMIHLHDIGDKLANQFADGTINAGQFGSGLLGALGPLHTISAYTGLLSTGTHVSSLGDLITVGNAMVANQSPYMEKFVSKMQTGGYGLPGSEDNPVDVKAINSRIDLYAQRLRGTANNAVVHVHRDRNARGKLTWRLDGAIVDHCDDCVALASGSPYDPSDLYTVPGDGSTECGPNCHCELLDDDGNPISF